MSEFSVDFAISEKAEIKFDARSGVRGKKKVHSRAKGEGRDVGNLSYKQLGTLYIQPNTTITLREMGKRVNCCRHRSPIHSSFSSPPPSSLPPPQPEMLAKRNRHS